MAKPHPAGDALTDDTLFQGELHCRQRRDGYRFSVDAVLAAHFCTPGPDDRVLDLGCGCGVIGLILAHRHRQLRVCGLELQTELADLAAANSVQNGFADRFALVRGDVGAIADLLLPESFDLVVCNPPYRKNGSGRINGDHQAACARHELTATIDDFVHAASFCVKNRGQVVFIYPAMRANPLLAALQRCRLTLKRLQPVYSYPGTDDARLVLVEAVKNGGEQCQLLAPFYIYDCKNGDYSPAMHQLYR